MYDDTDAEELRTRMQDVLDRLNLATTVEIEKITISMKVIGRKRPVEKVGRHAVMGDLALVPLNATMSFMSHLPGMANAEDSHSYRFWNFVRGDDGKFRPCKTLTRDRTLRSADFHTAMRRLLVRSVLGWMRQIKPDEDRKPSTSR